MATRVTYDFYVRRTFNGQAYYNTADAVTVSLTSSDPAKLGMPSTLTIPARWSEVGFQVVGMELAEDPVMLNASATGYAAAAPLPIQVVAPQLGFQGLDGTRRLDSGRDNFSVSLVTPGAPDQRTASETMVNLSITEATPAGIIGSFFDAVTEGNAITQVRIRSGFNISDDAYVGQPTTAPGSYKVMAMVSGVTNAISEVQAVVEEAPMLQLVSGYGSTAVGKKMRSEWYDFSVWRTINGQALYGAEEVTVNLTSSDPGKLGVPATMTIPAGESQGYFQMEGLELAEFPLTITATAPGYTAAAPLPIRVIAPQMSFVDLDGFRIPAGYRDDFLVRLETPGGFYQTAVADLQVELSILEPSPAGIVGGFFDEYWGGNPITQVRIPAGSADSGTAYVESPTTGPGSYKVGAEVPGLASGISEEQILADPPILHNPSCHLEEVASIGVRTVTVVSPPTAQQPAQEPRWT